MDLLSLLTALNEEIQAFLAHYASEDAGELVATGMTALRQLQGNLNQVGARMGELLALDGPARPPELSRYIQNLKQLQAMLQTTQRVLLARRSAMTERNQNMQRAFAWASACRATY